MIVFMGWYVLALPRNSESVGAAGVRCEVHQIVTKCSFRLKGNSSRSMRPGEQLKSWWKNSLIGVKMAEGRKLTRFLAIEEHP
jgi:hypothetical protein